MDAKRHSKCFDQASASCVVLCVNLVNGVFPVYSQSRFVPVGPYGAECWHIVYIRISSWISLPPGFRILSRIDIMKPDRISEREDSQALSFAQLSPDAPLKDPGFWILDSETCLVLQALVFCDFGFWIFRQKISIELVRAQISTFLPAARTHMDSGSWILDLVPGTQPI